MPVLQPDGLFANILILTLLDIEVIGGSGQLIYVGTAGILNNYTYMNLVLERLQAANSSGDAIEILQDIAMAITLTYP